jgi:hypothetical protein
MGALDRFLAECVAQPEDWDGQGADAVTEEVAAIARRMLPLVTERNGVPSFVGPTPSGSIAVSWQGRSGHYLECEVVAGGPLEWMEANRDEKPRHWTEDAPQ